LEKLNKNTAHRSFNDYENDNKYNNNLPNKYFIMYYWLNFDQN